MAEKGKAIHIEIKILMYLFVIERGVEDQTLAKMSLQP